MRAVRVLILGAVLAVSVPIIAWASHGKAGLWEYTIQTNMGAMPGMPDMSRMPPEARARMQAMGMGSHAGGITIRHCMTVADVNNDSGDMPHNSDCKMKNVRLSGHTFDADMVCTGRMNGTGHAHFVYDSPEHFSGTQTMHATTEGNTVNTTTNMSGRWVSPNCGKVH